MNARDRRTEPRHDADGEVVLTVSQPVEQEFRGRLVDVSESGFRAVHSCVTLSPGDVVAFTHQLASGEARVIWRRLHPKQPDQSECGFYVQRAQTA
jgi:hypothetical protein